MWKERGGNREGMKRGGRRREGKVREPMLILG